MVNEFYSKKTGKPYDGLNVWWLPRAFKYKDIDAVLSARPIIGLWSGHPFSEGRQDVKFKTASLPIAEGELWVMIPKSGIILPMEQQDQASI